MTRRHPFRSITRAVTTAVGTLLLAGCGASYSAPDEVTLPGAVTPSTVAAVQTEACVNDGTEVQSYAPLSPLPTAGDMPAGSRMREIQERGRLVVGTSIDTNLFSSLDPETNTIKGFDVDMATFVAQAIFGGSFKEAAERLDLRGITYAERIPSVVDGEVDIVAHTMTINCARWQQVAFSSVYLNAGQKLLVATDSEIDDLDDLNGKTVCVSAGGTSADEMRALADITVVEVNNQTDCVVLFQRGEADAIRSDDTVLAGFAEQDPYSQVVGEFLTLEPYGMAMSLEHPELTQFVNVVLQQAKDDGRWQERYTFWLEPALGPPSASIVLGRDPQEPGVPQAGPARPLPGQG